MFKMAVGLAILATPVGALAAPPQWRVSETSGDVRLVQNGQARVAARNALLSSGATIVTGPRAKAVIVRGEEFVIISPNSQLRLPAEQNSSGIMQIIEDFGTALFKIKKKSTAHFGVQTPYLAAVVKGTTFTVTVGAEGGSVQVTEGAVEVSTLDGGATHLITPGSIGTVGASDLFQLSVQADDVKTLRSDSAPPAGTVTSSVRPDAAPKFEGPRGGPVEIASPIGETPVSLADVTGGLVEGEAAIDVAAAQVSDRGLTQVARADSGSAPGSGVGNAASPGIGAVGDGNNGHGNDDDGVDESNPGSGASASNSGGRGGGSSGSGGGGSSGFGGGSGNSGSGNNNGNGNANSGPGNNNGSGNANSGPGNNNGNGNANSGPGNNNGNGNANSGPGNNNGNGNSGSGGGDDDDDDRGNSGRGGGGDDDDDD